MKRTKTNENFAIVTDFTLKNNFILTVKRLLSDKFVQLCLMIPSDLNRIKIRFMWRCVECIGHSFLSINGFDEADLFQIFFKMNPIFRENPINEM